MEARCYVNFLYLFISNMAPIYMLRINRSKDLLNPQISFYSQGMSFVNIPLTNISQWTLCRMSFPGGNVVIESLNSHFIRFQQILRNYFRLLRRVRNIRFLLNREVGLLPPVGK
jgi:hypothetical protein